MVVNDFSRCFSQFKVEWKQQTQTKLTNSDDNGSVIIGSRINEHKEVNQSQIQSIKSDMPRFNAYNPHGWLFKAK